MKCHSGTIEEGLHYMNKLKFFQKLPYNSCLFVFCVETLNSIRFNIGGDIGIGELCMIIYMGIHFHEIIRYPLIRMLGKLYLTLLGAQLFSELFVTNGLNDSIRGLMVTAMSFCHLSFLIYFFIKDFRIIIFGLLGAGVSILLLPTELDELTTFESIIDGEDAVYVKMRLAPALGYILSAIAIFVKNKLSIVLFILIGIGLIIGGARNGGMTFVLAALCALLLFNKKRKIKLSKIKIIFFIGVSYIAYILYVEGVQSGGFSSGNNYRVLDLQNPYNPLELLYKNRTEFFVGLHAFIDNFFLGMGAWAKDETGQYWKLLHKLSNDDSGFIGIWIPVHSVLMGWGVYNGVLAFIAGIKIVIIVLKKFILIVKSSLYNNYRVPICYMFIAFMWNLLFSPSSHFRMFLPIYMAVIFSIYVDIATSKRTHHERT